jgi:hypothetical protein
MNLESLSNSKDLYKKLPLKLKVKIGLGRFANDKMGGTFETVQIFDRLEKIEKELADARGALNSLFVASNEVNYGGHGTIVFKNKDYWEKVISKLEAEKTELESKLAKKAN